MLQLAILKMNGDSPEAWQDKPARLRQKDRDVPGADEAVPAIESRHGSCSRRRERRARCEAALIIGGDARDVALQGPFLPRPPWLSRASHPPAGTLPAFDVGLLGVGVALLRRRHDGGVDDLPAHQADGPGSTKASGLGRGQGRPRLQARHRLQKPDNLVGAQHHRQRARRAGIGNALRDLGMA
jgi:hypothetical protein